MPPVTVVKPGAVFAEEKALSPQAWQALQDLAKDPDAVDQRVREEIFWEIHDEIFDKLKDELPGDFPPPDPGDKASADDIIVADDGVVVVLGGEDPTNPDAPGSGGGGGDSGGSGSGGGGGGGDSGGSGGGGDSGGSGGGGGGDGDGGGGGGADALPSDDGGDDRNTGQIVFRRGSSLNDLLSGLAGSGSGRSRFGVLSGGRMGAIVRTVGSGTIDPAPDVSRELTVRGTFDHARLAGDAAALREGLGLSVR